MRSSLFVLAFAALPLAAQTRVPLDGEWQVRPEAKPDGWSAITVPSAFETALGVAFDGVAVYRRTLPLPAEKVAAVRIEFAAVATHATVFCNGTPVGEHLGGWTPFRVDVSNALRWNGADELEVRVDEKVGHNTQGFLPIIQPHFGGIWQSVTLCLDQGPVIDRLGLFAFGNDQGELRVEVPVLGPGDGDVDVTVELFAGERRLVRSSGPLAIGRAAAGLHRVDNPRLWAVSDPFLHDLRITLSSGGREIDRVERRVGFRGLRADGRRVLWNGAPLQVRGILHWGYSPPHLAPPTEREHWRAQLIHFRDRGFNLLKCCLWVPPRCVFELADELGMLVWQEYPTWHPRMDQAHKQELLTEYGEFFAHDRSHASVAFRSITCETGHGADLDVVKTLFDACKAAVPDTLVVDDSSWIGWQRVTDFWDEHPYGNNSWFPGRLADFDRHQRTAGEKPLLLGECIAADTWVDRAAWTAVHRDTAPWWRPDCWTAQGPAEAWLLAQTDEATVRSLRPQSLDFALRNRKFQIEQLRLRLPEAGYVVSVARDFGKARMGLLDDLDQPKWPASDWAWHGDTMLCLDAAWHERAVSFREPRRAVRIAHTGVDPLRGELRLHFGDPDSAQRWPVELQPGGTSEPFVVEVPVATRLGRARLFAELTGSHAARNHWDLWTIPPWHYRFTLVADRLTPDLLDQIEAGSHVVLQAGPQAGSPRTEAMWSLRGAPFAANYAGRDLLPADLLLELSSFDLESGRVIPWAPWADQIDPILGFWETHDIPEVRFHLLAGTTRIGKGRLAITSLRLDDDEESRSPMRLHVRELLANALSRHEPTRALSAATVAALRAQLTEKKIDLPTWRFRTDAADEGLAANWHDPAVDAVAAPWRELRAGSHWENQGDDLKHFTGVAWYRVDVDVPADWQGLAARAVFEGVDDSFHCWLNGELVGTFGDAATRTTIWLERQVAELDTKLRAGVRNTLVLRVVDHAGAGGLWKPVFLTTGPAGKGAPLLH
jgi:hypothetical protein